MGSRSTWRAFVNRFRDDERGSVAIYLGLSSTVLVGAMGLSAETGLWYFKQRETQHIADAAAIAAAYEFKRSGSGGASNLASIKTRVASLAVASGFAPDGTVNLNYPPSTTGSAYNGNVNAIEVILNKPQNRLFSSIFSNASVNLPGRAVANWSGGGGTGCVLALSQTVSPALEVSGSAAIDSVGCDLYSNSTASVSFKQNGAGASTKAGCIYSVGGQDVNQNATITLSKPECQPTGKTGVKPASDPYANVPSPTGSGLVCASSNVVEGSKNNDPPLEITHAREIPVGTTFMPATRYCGGLTIKGNVKFQPGLIIVDGGTVKNADFSSTGNSSITGTGVSFYLDNAELDFQSNFVLNLSAPTSGLYQGLLIWGDRTDTSLTHKVNGTAGGFLNGALYFPGNRLEISGDFSAGNGCTPMVADTIKFTGNTSFNVECPAGTPGGAFTVPVVASPVE